MLGSPADEMAVGCLGHRLRMISRAVMQVYEGPLQRHGLTVGQFTLLVAVCHARKITPKEVGRVLRFERYEVSKELGPLKQAGLLSEEPAPDGRTYHLVPTTEGEALLNRLLPDWRAAQARIRAMLTDEGERLVRGIADRLWPEAVIAIGEPG